MEIENQNSGLNEKLQRLQKHIATVQNSLSEQERNDSIAMIRAILEGPQGLQLLSQPEVFPFLYAGLAQNDPDIQQFCLLQMARLAENENLALALSEPQLLGLVFQCLTSEEISVAEAVSQFFQKLAIHSQGLRTVFASETLQQFNQLLGQSDIMKFRVLDIFAKVATLSAQAFPLCESSGMLSKIVAYLDTDDVLGKLNVIELLEKISSTQEGSHYLDQTQALVQLHNLLKSRDVLANFVIPRVIHFFGHLSTKGDYQLSLLEKYNILGVLKRNLSDDSNTSREVVESTITTLGQIGTTPRGIQLLESTSVLHPFLSFLSAEGDLRICSFRSVAFLLKNLSKNATDSEMNPIHKSLNTITTRTGKDSNVMNIVMPILISHPFPDVRYAAFDVIGGIASYKRGVEEYLMTYPGFYEFITNRSTEHTKEGKEWKFTIIQTIMNTATKSPEIVPKQKQNELIRYLKNGVFFIAAEATMEVATQDAV